MTLPRVPSLTHPSHPPLAQLPPGGLPAGTEPPGRAHASIAWGAPGTSVPMALISDLFTFIFIHTPVFVGTGD